MNSFLWVPCEAIRGRWRALSTVPFGFDDRVVPLRDSAEDQWLSLDACAKLIWQHRPLVPGNQGLSTSPYDMRNVVFKCVLFLLPILSSVSLDIEHFMHSRWEPFLPSRHACHSCKSMQRGRLLRNLMAWRWPWSIQKNQVWVEWSTHRSLPQLLHYF